MKDIPIKFRGKRVKDGKTVYGWAYKSECPMSSFPAIIDYNDKYNAIYPESVAQLVGYDADGDEVYEDDTLELFNEEYTIKAKLEANVILFLFRKVDDNV